MNNDRYHIKENAEFLKDLGKKYGNVLNRTTMINFVNDAKEKSSISTSVNFGIMVKYLVDVLGLFEEIRIYPDNKEPIIRYVAKYISVSPYEIALSLKSKSFLSHYSALYVHDLTINNPKEIYINTEQTLKPRNEANSKLTQGKIDFAFSSLEKLFNNLLVLSASSEPFSKKVFTPIAIGTSPKKPIYLLGIFEM